VSQELVHVETESMRFTRVKPSTEDGRRVARFPKVSSVHCSYLESHSKRGGKKLWSCTILDEKGEPFFFRTFEGGTENPISVPFGTRMTMRNGAVDVQGNKLTYVPQAAAKCTLTVPKAADLRKEASMPGRVDLGQMECHVE
jgi:hypothetical protein